MEGRVNLTPCQNLLYYFSSILGLAPFSIEDNTLRPLGFLRKAYAVLLFLFNVVWTSDIFVNGRSQGTEVTPMYRYVLKMALSLLLGNMCAILLTFVFKSEKLIEIWNGITATSDGVKKLSTDGDREIGWKYLFAKSILTNSVLVAMIVSLAISSQYDHAPRSTRSEILFWLGWMTTAMQRHNAMVIFAETVIYIRQLFGALNERLQDAVQPNCDLPLSGDQHGSTARGLRRNRPDADSPARRVIAEPRGAQLRAEDVQEIAKLHRELCDLVESVTDCFTVPILLNLVQHFSSLLSNCYSLYRHGVASREIFESSDTLILDVGRLMAWALVSLMELSLIAHACTSMSRVGNATKAVLHEFWNKFYPEELRKEVFKFSLQILHKPVAVSVFGFFDLGYSCMYKIFCALVAYLVIMMQLDTSTHPNPGT